MTREALSHFAWAVHFPDTVWVVDVAGRVLAVNKQGPGAPLVTLESGSSLSQIIFPNDQPQFHKALKAPPQGSRMELRMRTTRGVWAWHELVVFQAPEPDQVYVKARDFSRAHRALTLSDQCAAVARIGGWEVDLRTGDTFWSKVTHEIHGTDPDTWNPNVGTGIEFYAPECRAQLTEAFNDLAASGRGFDMQFDIINVQGRRVPVRVIGLAEFEDGRPVRAFGTFQDISALERTENLLANIIDNLPLMFFAKDARRNFAFTHWNKEAERITGIAKGEIIGKTDADFFAPEKVKEFRERDEEALRAGRIEIREESVDGKSGTSWLRTRKAPVLDKDGDPHLLLGISEDITATREAQSRLQLALDSAKLGIWEYNVARDELIWDDTQYQIYGVPKGQFGGDFKSWLAILAEEERDRIVHEMELIKSSPHLSHSLSFKVKCPDGRIKFVDSNMRMEKNASGEVVRIVGVNQDVTEREAARAELEIQRANVMNSAKLASLGEVAGGIAHEINNPLMIIVGKSRVLRRALEAWPDVMGIAREGLDVIDATVLRISRIVQGMRRLSRSAERDPMAPVLVRDVVGDTLEIIREQIRMNGIDLKEDPIPAELVVLGRSSQLAQVLLNLLNNALDAVRTLDTKWIEIKAWRKDATVCISVRDSGRGISPQHVSRLMQPFFTTKEPGRGTGLGLSISKAIIDAHNGALSYDLSEGHTRFMIALADHQGAAAVSPARSLQGTG